MALPATPPDKMSFWEHLQELRVRIVRSLLIVAVCFAVTYAFRFKLWAWAQKPFLDAMARQTGKAVADLQPFAFTDLTEPFFSLMRLSLWAAAFVAAPLLFYQLWAFIRPGLLPKERRLVIPFVVVTSGCFLAGSTFAYFQAFKFLGDILFQEAAAAGLRANLHVSKTHGLREQRHRLRPAYAADDVALRAVDIESEPFDARPHPPVQLADVAFHVTAGIARRAHGERLGAGAFGPPRGGVGTVDGVRMRTMTELARHEPGIEPHREEIRLAARAKPDPVRPEVVKVTCGGA